VRKWTGEGKEKRWSIPAWLATLLRNVSFILQSTVRLGNEKEKPLCRAFFDAFSLFTLVNRFGFVKPLID